MTSSLPSTCPEEVDPPGHGRHRWSLVLVTVSVRPRSRTKKLNKFNNIHMITIRKYFP